MAGKASICMEASIVAHSVALKAQALQTHQVGFFLFDVHLCNIWCMAGLLDLFQCWLC